MCADFRVFLEVFLKKNSDLKRLIYYREYNAVLYNGRKGAIWSNDSLYELRQSLQLAELERRKVKN